MRELSDDFKISARSVGEVAEAINAMVSRLRTTGEVKYLGRNLTRESLINAAVLYVDSLPHPEKAKALGIGMQRLEAILRTDGSEVGGMSSFDPASPIAEDDAAPHAPKRRKRG